MTLYESVFIARQDVSTTQVEAMADRFAQIIADNGGVVEKREYWGLRNLAYRVKKNRKGHYVLFNLSAPSDALREMERNMRIDEDVLRFLSVRIEAMRDQPSPVLQGRGERSERRGRRDHEDDRGGREGRGDRFDRGDRPARDSETSNTVAEETSA